MLILIAVTVILASFWSPSIQIYGAIAVGQWDRFEASVTNGTAYANPYTDVALNVIFTKPDSTTVAFWGFYDGGTTWKIRFMPDQLGTWSYTASFSDGSPGITGTFTCIPSTIPGMISTDKTNPTWFGFSSGKHTLVRSFHVGDRFFAANLPVASRTAFLNWAGAQGYNTLSIGSFFLNRNIPSRGAGWQTPQLWPLNAGEYQKAEAILNDLAIRHIMVFPFSGFFGANSNFPTLASDQLSYIRYTLARFGPYWNMLFSVAGPEPIPSAYLTQVQIDQLGTLIQSLDVFHHPLSVHNALGNDPFINSTWSSFSTVQGGHTVVRTTLNNFLLTNHNVAKPLYAQEVLWPGNEFNPAYSAADIRKNAYVVNMSAAALNFGDMNGNSSSGFSGTMDLTLKNQAMHNIVKSVWDFFSLVPYYRMSPCQNLVSTGFCLAQAGQEYLIYLDSTRSVNVALSGGPYTVEWINGQNTADRRPGGTTTTGQGLVPPGGGDDWFAHLYTGANALPTPTPGSPNPNTSGTPSNDGNSIDLADPVITKESDPSLARPGESVKFIISVTNRGSVAASSLSIRDAVPFPLRLVSAQTTQGNVQRSGNIVVFSIGNVNPGQVVTLIVWTQIRSDASVPQDVVNIAELVGLGRSASASVHITKGILPSTGEHP